MSSQARSSPAIDVSGMKERAHQITQKKNVKLSKVF